MYCHKFVDLLTGCSAGHHQVMTEKAICVTLSVLRHCSILSLPSTVPSPLIMTSVMLKVMSSQKNQA